MFFEYNLVFVFMYYFKRVVGFKFMIVNLLDYFGIEKNDFFLFVFLFGIFERFYLYLFYK